MESTLFTNPVKVETDLPLNPVSQEIICTKTSITGGVITRITPSAIIKK